MWLIRFSVFCIDEYFFHAYILIIFVQSCFFILLSARDLLLFVINSVSFFKFSSISFGQSKLKEIAFRDPKSFRISYHKHTLFHHYNDLIKLLQSFLVIYSVDKKDKVFFCFHFSHCMNCFFCANNIESLVNSLFGVKIFIPAPDAFPL